MKVALLDELIRRAIAAGINLSSIGTVTIGELEYLVTSKELKEKAK